MLDFVPLAGAGGQVGEMSRPSSLASFWSSRFHSRTREPLLPPLSAAISNRVAGSTAKVEHASSALAMRSAGEL